MPRRTPQKKLVLKHMQTKGPLTALEALNRYGILRLAARVLDLKHDNIPVQATKVKTRTGKWVAAYYLLPPF